MRLIMASLTIAVVAIGGPARAQHSERLPVTDLKPLLKRAIAHGAARGVLVGEAAVILRQKFDVSAPIEIDVRAIETLRDPGCSRLEVTTRQVGVLENRKRDDKVLTYQVNYCNDGRMPERN